MLRLDYRLCITGIIDVQLWGCKVEEKFCLGVPEQVGLNTTGVEHQQVLPEDRQAVVHERGEYQ
jgi:hypothetical protein